MEEKKEEEGGEEVKMEEEGVCTLVSSYNTVQQLLSGRHTSDTAIHF